jgi:hypothetical protein
MTVREIFLFLFWPPRSGWSVGALERWMCGVEAFLRVSRKSRPGKISHLMVLQCFFLQRYDRSKSDEILYANKCT